MKIFLEHANKAIEIPDEKRLHCYKELLSNVVSMTSLENYPESVTTSMLENLAKILDKVIINYLDRDLKEFKEKNARNINMKNDDYAEQYRQYFAVNFNNDMSLFMKMLWTKYPMMGDQLNLLTTDYLANMTQFLQRLGNDMDVLQKSLLKNISEPKLVKISSSGSDFHKKGKQVLILTFQGADNEKIKVVYKPSPLVADAMLFGDVANLSKLDKRFSKFENQCSFIELMNNITKRYATSIETKFTTIPTYMIIPCQDAGEAISEEKLEIGKLGGDYGYIEFLTPSDQDPTDYESLIVEKLIEDKHNDVDLAVEEYQDLVDDAYDKFTQTLANDHTRSFDASVKKRYPQLTGELLDRYSYISDSDIKKRYSYNCGVLQALMTMTSISDNHAENLIIHNMRPYLIDAEACFCANVNPTPADSSSFDLVTGSMNANSKVSEVYTFLIDGRGKIDIKISKPTHNILYMINEDEYSDTVDKYLPYQPDSKQLLEAYHQTLELFSSNKDEVLNWYDQAAVKEMKIRVIPRSTAGFQEHLSALKAKEFEYDTYEKNCLKLITDVNGLDGYQRKISTYNNALIKSNKIEQNTASSLVDMSEVDQPSSSFIEKMLPVVPAPYVVIYTNPDNNRNILSEYIHNSIPVYYMVANELELIDYNGDAVAIPETIASLRNCIGENCSDELLEDLAEQAKTKYKRELPAIDSSANDTKFMVESPLAITKGRANKILTNSLIREQLYVVVQEQTIHYQAKAMESERGLYQEEQAINRLASALKLLSGVNVEFITRNNFENHVKKIANVNFDLYYDEILRAYTSNFLKTASFPFLYFNDNHSNRYLLQTLAKFGIDKGFLDKIEKKDIVRQDLINNTQFLENFSAAYLNTLDELKVKDVFEAVFSRLEIGKNAFHFEPPVPGRPYMTLIINDKKLKDQFESILQAAGVKTHLKNRYQLCAMREDTVIEPGKLYVNYAEDPIKYATIAPNGKRVSGTISYAKFNPKLLQPVLFKHMEMHFDAMLSITTKQGHTSNDKDLAVDFTPDNLNQLLSKDFLNMLGAVAKLVVLAHHFQGWMMGNDGYHHINNHFSDHRAAILDWIKNDNKAKEMKEFDYVLFCNFVSEIRKLGYAIDTLPSEKEFYNAISEAKQTILQSYVGTVFNPGKQDQVFSSAKRTQSYLSKDALVADVLQWQKDHGKVISSPDFMASWLAEQGGQYVETYKQFLTLYYELEKKLPKIYCPTEYQFQVALNQFNAAPVKKNL